MEVKEVTKNNNGHLGVVTEMFSMGHEKVLICQDSSVGLKAIIAVHSTVCGPSLGGTRMWKYDNEEEALIDEFFYSPYHPDGISDKYDHLKSLRKPNTGMLELACAKWEIDIGKSIMIGDSQTDIECAHNFGIHGYLFNENNLLSFVEEQIKIR